MRTLASRRCSATRSVDQKRSETDSALTPRALYRSDCDQRKRRDAAHIRCAGSCVSRANLRQEGMAMRLLASSLALVVVLGACGGAAAPSPTPVPTPTASPTPSPTAVV